MGGGVLPRFRVLVVTRFGLIRPYCMNHWGAQGVNMRVGL